MAGFIHPRDTEKIRANYKGKINSNHGVHGTHGEESGKSQRQPGIARVNADQNLSKRFRVATLDTPLSNEEPALILA